jgi:hypothetical protein
MRSFFEDGKARIRAAGLKPTIGFNSLNTLLQTGITTEINQFHHYPGGQRTLQPNAFDPQFPAIVGEFATAPTDVWPELEETGQSVLNRLRLASDLGYPLAMPWCFLAKDDHTAWSAEVEQEIECFTQGRNCP